MRNEITRTITTTTATVASIKVIDNGLVHGEPKEILLIGEYTNKQLDKALNALDVLKDEMLIVLSVEKSKKTYVLSLAEFINAAHEVTTEPKTPAEAE